MKLTFCAYDKANYINGPNAWLQRILPILQEKGIQCKVIFILFKDTTPEECSTLMFLKSKGIGIEVIDREYFIEDTSRFVLERLQADPPDVFVPNLTLAGYYAGKWVREAGIPTVGILHSDDPFYRALQDEFVFGQGDFSVASIVCVSRLLEKQVANRAPQHTEIVRIPYGTPVPEARIQIPDAHTSLKLIYVGRIVDEQKRITDLTRALCRATKEVEGVEAYLFGSGLQEEDVKAIIADAGDTAKVYFMGRVSSAEIQNRMLSNHAFVLLSDYEGIPIALMEAMACGMIPVCSRIESGIPELIDDYETGILVDDRGDHFVKVIRELRNDPTLCDRISRNAQQKIIRELSFDYTSELWFAHLKALHANHGQKQRIRIPWDMKLPPSHSTLVGEDHRKPRGFRRIRYELSMLKQRVLRTFTGK